MPNGKPGDDPLLDLFLHQQHVFSPVIDSLLWDIQKLAGPYPEASFWHHLDIDWFNPSLDRLEQRLNSIRDELMQDAQKHGWEIE
jgi:hypothetical protein